MTTNEQEREVKQRIEGLLAKYSMNFEQDIKDFINLLTSLDIDPFKVKVLQNFFVLNCAKHLHWLGDFTHEATELAIEIHRDNENVERDNQ